MYSAGGAVALTPARRPRWIVGRSWPGLASRNCTRRHLANDDRNSTDHAPWPTRMSSVVTLLTTAWSVCWPQLGQSVDHSVVSLLTTAWSLCWPQRGQSADHSVVSLLTTAWSLCWPQRGHFADHSVVSLLTTAWSLCWPVTTPSNWSPQPRLSPSHTTRCHRKSVHCRLWAKKCHHNYGKYRNWFSAFCRCDRLSRNLQWNHR